MTQAPRLIFLVAPLCSTPAHGLEVDDACLAGAHVVGAVALRSNAHLCETALEDTRRLMPKVRIMAMQQQAHGASLIDDRPAVDLLIDQADHLLGRVDDDLPWGNACRRTPGYLEVQRATCYGRLGLGVEASALWGQVLEAAPATARRDRGVYLARHAAAAATALQPDQAVEIAREAAVIAVETGSARMRRELGTLQQAMRPWHDAPVGRDLSELLAPVAERGSA